MASISRRMLLQHGVMVTLSVLLTASGVCAGARTTVLVPLTAEPSWRDFAFLAAIPAAVIANNGYPSLIALDESGKTTPEIDDYTRRYRPEVVYLLGGIVENLVIAGKTCTALIAGSGDEAACMLSRKFWRTSAMAVICPEDDYEAGLIAAALAARLRAPLLFVAAQGLSKPAADELRRLKARGVIVVGKPCAGSQVLKKMMKQVVELADARAVMEWARVRKLSVDYIAAVNPTDRNRTVIKKLSLAGALLAAGRGGLVAPLTYETRWKIGFTGTEIDGELPAGLPKSEAKPIKGIIAFEGCPKHNFIVTGKPKERDLRVNIDTKGDGTYSGPLGTGDTVALDGKVYVITLGAKNGFGKSDLRLTWPSAEQLCEDLREYYKVLAVHPDYLCIVGFPEAIPQSIVNKGNFVDDLTSDLPYANADEDQFAEIGIARLIAENVSFATLYASRVLTYQSLLDPAWQDRACQADWENTYGNLFENVGFDASYRHTKDDLKWIVPPTEGNKGKRASTFDQSSPLASCAALAHMHHSYWHGFGSTFQWDAEVLLAPVVVETGGCLTAALDREADYRTVIARILRKGAVCFVGNSREGIAASELQRHEFWNGVLSGRSIGSAHRSSMNSALVTIFDKKQEKGGGYWYQRQIRTLFGDPAFVMRVPGKPKSAPARVSVEGNTVSVFAPQQWWPVKMHVPEDWKKWADKDLYVLRGAGTYAHRTWCSDEYDREEMYMTAEFTTRRRVVKIEQVQKPPEPLGWCGKFYDDKNTDGTWTYRWSVRMADFDQINGKIINVVDRLDYRVSYE